MLYKIIGDSCMDLTEELKLDPHFQMIPLTLQIGDYKVTDDETFNQKEFLAKVKASSECPKTACPSPESFKEAFEGEAEYIFVVTLSNHLRKRTERTGRRLQSLIPCRRRRAS